MSSRSNPAHRSSGGPAEPEQPNAQPRPPDPARAVAFILGQSQLTHELTVVVDGDAFTFFYHRLSWQEIDQIEADAWSVEERKLPNGKVELTQQYDQTKYKAGALLKMFMGPDLARRQPFPLTEQLISRFSTEIGEQFADVIPLPNMAQKTQILESLKKVYGESSPTEQDQTTLPSTGG